MKTPIPILLLVAVTSCGGPRHLPTVRDSTVVHYRDSLRIKDSLVFVNIPVESSSQVTFPTDTSHLETSVARSDAWVDTCGRIHHTLNNKYDSRLPVIVPIIDRARVSDNTQTLTRVQIVERELTPWQSFRLKAFWWLAGIVLIAFSLIILKFVR